MNIHFLSKVTYMAAMSALVLLVAGMLWGQAGPQQQPMPRQDYPNQQNPSMQDPQQMPTHSNVVSDQDFAKEAASGGMAEVKLGQLAQDKGSSDEVKNFGKRMVDDHTAANDKLKGVASRENVQLPAEMSKKDRKTYDRLSQLSGDAFDKAYAKDMVQDHETDIAAFKSEASNGQNARIKDFASSTLPTLEEHLKMAKEMQRAVAKGGTAKPGGQE